MYIVIFSYVKLIIVRKIYCRFSETVSQKNGFTAYGFNRAQPPAESIKTYFPRLDLRDKGKTVLSLKSIKVDNILKLAFSIRLSGWHRVLLLISTLNKLKY